MNEIFRRANELALLVEQEREKYIKQYAEAQNRRSKAILDHVAHCYDMAFDSLYAIEDLGRLAGF